MRLRQLEYFVAVCEAGSFTAAATRLYVAQPSLSQQIRALETDLGATLIERSSQGVRLTTAGRVFLADARKVLACVAQARQGVRDVVEGREGDLHVLTIRSVASGILPPTVVRWHTLFPGTVLRMHDFSHRRDLEEALRIGRGELAVGPRPAGWGGPILSLGYEQLVVIGPRAVANQLPITREEMETADWVAFEPEQGMSEVIDWVATNLAFTPRIVARTGQVAAALLLAVEGIGLALVPENAVPAHWAAHARRVGGGAYRELVAYTRAAPSQLAERYWSLLSQIDLPLMSKDQLPVHALTM